MALHVRCAIVVPSATIHGRLFATDVSAKFEVTWHNN